MIKPTLVTHIWLVVSVPVLSEQMTEVQPRVSTEGRLLTMAFFLAIRRVPRARQVVITAGRPVTQSPICLGAMFKFYFLIQEMGIPVEMTVGRSYGR